MTYLISVIHLIILLLLDIISFGFFFSPYDQINQDTLE